PDGRVKGRRLAEPAGGRHAHRVRLRSLRQGPASFQPASVSACTDLLEQAQRTGLAGRSSLDAATPLETARSPAARWLPGACLVVPARAAVTRWRSASARSWALPRPRPVPPPPPGAAGAQGGPAPEDPRSPPLQPQPARKLLRSGPCRQAVS